MWSVQCHWSHSSGKLWSNCKWNFLWGDWAPKCSFYVLASPHASVSSVKNPALTKMVMRLSVRCAESSPSHRKAALSTRGLSVRTLWLWRLGKERGWQHCNTATLLGKERGWWPLLLLSLLPGSGTIGGHPESGLCNHKETKNIFAMKYFTHQHYIDRSSTQEMVPFIANLRMKSIESLPKQKTIDCDYYWRS